MKCEVECRDEKNPQQAVGYPAYRYPDGMHVQIGHGKKGGFGRYVHIDNYSSVYLFQGINHVIFEAEIVNRVFPDDITGGIGATVETLTKRAALSRALIDGHRAIRQSLQSRNQYAY